MRPDRKGSPWPSVRAIVAAVVSIWTAIRGHLPTIRMPHPSILNRYMGQSENNRVSGPGLSDDQSQLVCQALSKLTYVRAIVRAFGYPLYKEKLTH